MDIEYSISHKCSAEEVAEVFRSSGIRRPVEDLDRIQRMIDHADEIITARVAGKLVGFIRAITDYSYCCYISDLAVDLEYQRTGIGKELIRRLMEKLGNEEVKFVLTSAPLATEFYEKIGFEKDHLAYVVKRLNN